MRRRRAGGKEMRRSLKCAGLSDVTGAIGDQSKMLFLLGGHQLSPDFAVRELLGVDIIVIHATGQI